MNEQVGKRAGSKAADRGPGTSSLLKTRALNVVLPWRWFRGNL